MHAALFYDYHYFIADSFGNTAVIEYINGEMKVLRGNEYAMNFYLSEGGDNRRAIGYDREKTVSACLEVCGGTMEEKEAADLLWRCLVSFRHRRGYMIKTLWSAVYNCSVPSVTLYSDGDFTKSYRFDLKIKNESENSADDSFRNTQNMFGGQK